MIRYQGEDIPFTIEIENQDGTQEGIANFSDFAQVILYAKTPDHTSKFSMTEKDGYSELSLADNKLSGTITSSETKLMHGELTFEVMFEKASTQGDEKENMIRKIYTGIIINRNSIKHDVV